MIHLQDKKVINSESASKTFYFNNQDFPSLGRYGVIKQYLTIQSLIYFSYLGKLYDSAGSKIKQ